jgi:hypothetical protein
MQQLFVMLSDPRIINIIAKYDREDGGYTLI